MVPFSYETDPRLANFTNDYIDESLDSTERMAFREFLATDEPLAAFVNQVRKGRQALRNANQVKAADDFEEKLFERIAREREQTRSEEDLTSA